MSGRSDELGAGKPQAGPSHERIGRDAERTGDAEDGDQRRVPEATLELGDVGRARGRPRALLCGSTIVDRSRRT